MKLARIGLLTAGAVVLFGSGVGGFLYYQEYQEEKAVANQKAAQQAFMQAQLAQITAQKLKDNARPMADKGMKEGVPEKYSRQESDWIATEKSIYQKILSSGKFDVLIVPFQVQEYALDRATRSFMTAELALVSSASKKLRIPDPYLVARALGEGERRLDPNEVYALADKIGVNKIIWSYVGHNRNNEMALTIQFQERGPDGILNAQTITTSKNFEHIAFTDTVTPIEAYQSLLPGILSAIGVDGSGLITIEPERGSHPAVIPVSPLAMVNENNDPARDALYFQLLAYLTPDLAERTKERFAEKSLLAILSMSTDSKEYRVLKARALMLLGMRPAALNVLGAPKEIEEKELFAVLNGNQTEVDQLSSEIKPSITKVISRLDSNSIDGIYGGFNKTKSIEAANSLKLPGKIWPFLAARSFLDLDSWSQFDNIYLKQLLDHDFPIKNYTAEEIIRGAAVAGDVEKMQTLSDLSITNHIRKLLEMNAGKICCEFTIQRPSSLDYLNLIEAIGEDNLMRRARFLTITQGVPDRTLEFLNRIENVYKGHSEYSMVRAQAQIELAKQVDGAEKEGLLKSAFNNAIDSLYLEQGQTQISTVDLDLVGLSGHENDYGPHNNPYVADYPFRDYYNNWEQDDKWHVPNAEAALKNSTYNLKALIHLNWYFSEISKQSNRRDELFKDVEGRFAGNPALYQLLAKNSMDKGDPQSADKYYRESIKVQPMAWHAYMELGDILIETGKLDQAVKLFMSYPAFKNNSNENPVGISNSAYQAGSKFYWLGEFSLATPLYKLASRKKTGSAADIASSARLELINGDFHGALVGSLERARHYNDSYAYRDYLGMLHAMGASKEAWDAFNVLVSQLDDSHLWETVLVAHRKEGKSEADVLNWVKQEIQHDKMGDNNNRAAKYLLRAAVTDRIPTKELASNLAGVAQPVTMEFGRLVIQSSKDGKYREIQGPRSSEINALPVGMFDPAKKTVVKSNLVYFAESYQYIVTADYGSARALLQEASAVYDMSHVNLSYILPYYAFAAAKSGDVSGIEKYMAGFERESKGYDYLLAQAVIAGTAGKIEESVQLLKSALYRRPFTEDRPLQTEYQYADICKLLYESTGNSKFKAIALDWAKKNQKFQPWFAWAYAMEAAYTNNKADRKKAIAMAYYLDPHSEMLGKIPRGEREIAVKEFVGRNPFLQKNNAAAQTPI